jgi:DNA-binding transcriptional LysR family regulator
VSLSDYGYYLVYPSAAAPDSAVKIFRDWIMREAQFG